MSVKSSGWRTRRSREPDPRMERVCFGIVMA